MINPNEFVCIERLFPSLPVLSLDSVCTFQSSLCIVSKVRMYVCKHSLVAMLPNYYKCIICNHNIISLTCTHTHCRQEPTQAPSHAHLLISVNAIVFTS